jgi:hypothetical protein
MLPNLSFQKYSQEKTFNVLLDNTQWQWGVMPGVASQALLGKEQPGLQN